MGTVYVFFADGFEEMEAFAAVDVLKRAGVNVAMVSVTPDEIVKGAHGISVLCDKNIVNCDFYDAEMLVLPGGLPGATTLNECEDLRKELLKHASANKAIAAICAAPMVLGNLGLLKGKKLLAIQALINIWKEPNIRVQWLKKMVTLSPVKGLVLR